jgi:hypothetical protein
VLLDVARAVAAQARSGAAGIASWSG